MQTTVCPARASPSRLAATSLAMKESSPEVGSSSSSTPGHVSSARAMVTRFAWPPERPRRSASGEPDGLALSRPASPPSAPPPPSMPTRPLPTPPPPRPPPIPLPPLPPTTPPLPSPPAPPPLATPPPSTLPSPQLPPPPPPPNPPPPSPTVPLPPAPSPLPPPPPTSPPAPPPSAPPPPSPPTPPLPTPPPTPHTPPLPAQPPPPSPGPLSPPLGSSHPSGTSHTRRGTSYSTLSTATAQLRHPTVPPQLMATPSTLHLMAETGPGRCTTPTPLAFILPLLAAPVSLAIPPNNLLPPSAPSASPCHTQPVFAPRSRSHMANSSSSYSRTASALPTLTPPMWPRA